MSNNLWVRINFMKWELYILEMYQAFYRRAIKEKNKEDIMYYGKLYLTRLRKLVHHEKQQ